jgi:hypothetical protein
MEPAPERAHRVLLSAALLRVKKIRLWVIGASVIAFGAVSHAVLKLDLLPDRLSMVLFACMAFRRRLGLRCSHADWRPGC